MQNNIICDIMNKRKLKKLRQELDNLRVHPSNLRNTELVKFATKLGRFKSNRGKEPTYVSDLLPQSRPISIPNHPGSFPRYTAISILDALEQDIDELEEILPE